MTYIDFREVRLIAPIEHVARNVLKLELTKDNMQYRCVCPGCGSDDPRSIVITPDRKLFFCFAARKGGDVVELFAHVLSTSQKKAAEVLHDLYKSGIPKKEEPKAPTELQPLAHLDTNHELVQTMGFKDIAEQVGIGFTNRGMMRGYVAIPIRAPDGKLLGYCGVKGEVKTPPQWRVT